MIGALLLTTSALALPPAADDAAGQAFTKVIERMDAVERSLRTSTFRFYQREWVNGRMSDLVVLAVKLRHPHDRFLEYVGDKHTGRKVLYRGPSWNDGDMRVDPNLPLTPNLNLDPNGRLATDGQRYTILEMSVSRTVKLVVRDAIKVRDHPSWVPQVQDLGVEMVHGEQGRCFDTVSPKDEDPSFYGSRTKLCVNEKVGLPNLLKTWNVEDGAMRLVEDYAYIGMVVNPALSDADFDPDAAGF